MREPPSAAACKAGFPNDRRTMSSVFSILLNDRWRASDFFVERFPRLLSSKTHSWPPVSHRLQGGPFSAPTHFILSLRQTVQALEPLVCLIFWVLEPPAASSPSSLNSPSCSNLVFFLAASLSLAGRFPEALATLPPLDGSGLSREESDSGVGWDAGGGGGGNKPDCGPDSPAC